MVAAIFLALAVVGAFALQRFPRVRIGFDAVCFAAASLYLYSQDKFPIFAPLHGATDSVALGLRGVGAAWWMLGSRLIVALLWLVHGRNRRTRETRLFFDLASGAIYLATGAVILNSVFALPVAGIVATSGVVAIVLGLALQNTLADVFSGIAVGIESPFEVGDRIQIADRTEGQVVQINWRSIRIQTDGDDIAIIPNSLIAKAEIVNRSRPSRRRAGSVEIRCPNRVAPERVLDTLLDATLLCPDILRAPPPRGALVRIGARRSTYRISYFVDSPERLNAATDALLRGIRRQLHFAGHLGHRSASSTDDCLLMQDCDLARQLMREVVLFECLGPTQIDGIAAQLESLRLEPEEELFTQGTIDPSLYIVASGIIEFTRQLGPLSKSVGFIGAGEYVGEIGMLTNAPHAATAVAATHSRVFRLGRAALAPLLNENAHLATAFDKSARRGLEILNRSVAAQVTPTIGTPGQLLQRILSIFHLPRQGD